MSSSKSKGVEIPGLPGETDEPTGEATNIETGFVAAPGEALPDIAQAGGEPLEPAGEPVEDAAEGVELVLRVATLGRKRGETVVVADEATAAELVRNGTCRRPKPDAQPEG